MILRNQISRNINLVGTNDFRMLCNATGELNVLIQYLSENGKTTEKNL